MAFSTLSFTVPAVAAAAGAYFLGHHHQTKSMNTENEIKETMKSMLKSEEKQQKKKVDLPRFAVELDGLHCFETVVA